MDRKFFTRFLIAALLVFLAIGFFGNTETYFVGNLTPEITGVCLELLIILWVFEKWQERAQRQKLITLERRLREYLIFFLRHNFKTLPPNYRIGRFFGEDHAENTSKLESICQYISSQGLDEATVIAIQEHCRKEASTLDNLLPVASELTNEHFKAWARIVHFVNCIVYRQEPVGQSVKDILNNIKRFDKASFDSGLYVGAEKNITR